MPNETEKGAASGGARLPKGKKQMLVIMDQELIKELKMAALADDMKLSHAVEEATRDWLIKRKSRKGIAPK